MLCFYHFHVKFCLVDIISQVGSALLCVVKIVLIQMVQYPFPDGKVMLITITVPTHRLEPFDGRGPGYFHLLCTIILRRIFIFYITQKMIPPHFDGCLIPPKLCLAVFGSSCFHDANLLKIFQYYANVEGLFFGSLFA